MAVYTEVSDEELSAFLDTYDIGTVLSYKGIAEGVENTNYFLHTTKGSYILTLYEKRVREDDLPFFLGLMQHLALKGPELPAAGRQPSGRGLGRVSRAARRHHHVPRRHRGPPPHGAALRGARRGAGEAASGRPGFCHAAAQRAFARGLGAALRAGRGAGRHGLCPVSQSGRGGSSRIFKTRGRAACRPASSTPTFSPTTCSSSAPRFRG